MFGVLYAEEGSSIEAVQEVALEFSPRIEMNSPREVTIDLSGLTRLFGDARAMGAALGRTAVDRGLRVRLAVAGTRTAARLLAHGSRETVTIVNPGDEAVVLARLPVHLLTIFAHDESTPSHPRTLAPPHRHTTAPSHRRTVAPLHDMVQTFRRWGLGTLGEVAALPSDAMAARLGQQGVRWQRLARGEDPRPLLPVVPEERFEQTIDLEWPIEGLEPLSFVLGRLMEPLAAHLDRRGRGAAVLHVRLHLVTRTVYERTLELSTPIREARTLRTLALLDLESHPPDAAIDRVCVAVEPTPARDLQYSLLTRPLPSPEQISTLMARLTALMGEGRCGSPAVVDSWEPGAFEMKAFAPADSNVLDRPQRHRGTERDILHTLHGSERTRKNLDGLCVSESLWPVGAVEVSSAPAVALRRFRHPVPARVRVERGRPVSVGGTVTQCAGPWRTAGNWWTEETWDRDEWDVTLSDGAAYRVFRDRRADTWFIEGVLD
jgi:protein ImuB